MASPSAPMSNDVFGVVPLNVFIIFAVLFLVLAGVAIAALLLWLQRSKKRDKDEW